MGSAIPDANASIRDVNNFGEYLWWCPVHDYNGRGTVVIPEIADLCLFAPQK